MQDAACSIDSLCDSCVFEVVVRKIDDDTPNLEAAELQVRCLLLVTIMP